MPFESKAQMRKCYAMKAKGQAPSWDCSEWAKHTPNIKKLPERVLETEEEKKAFKVGFLARCMEEKLEPEEIVERVKRASWLPGWDAAKDTGKFLMENYRNALFAGLIAAPIVGGASIGAQVGAMRNISDRGSTELLKLQNRLQVYKQMAEESKQRASLRKLQEKNPGQIVPIG